MAVGQKCKYCLLSLFYRIALQFRGPLFGVKSFCSNKKNFVSRYLKEWLCLMASGDIIEVDESGERFWLREERIPLLTGQTPSIMFVFQPHTQMFGQAYSAVLEVFKKDGPLGWFLLPIGFLA